MRPDQPLFIYELRALEPRALLTFEDPKTRKILGKDLAGFHFEADFAFLFFKKEPDLDSFLKNQPLLELREIHHLRYDQWQDGALASPIHIGPLSIMPAEDKPITPENSKVSTIYIDPGLAFGFGGHPTTKACLSFLMRLYQPGTTKTSPPLSALDLGSGTGVLSLAAIALGAKKVVGVDHSHLAAEAGLYNVHLNQMEDRIEIVRGLAQDFAKSPADLLMANIPLFVLTDLVALGAFENRKHLIISGLLPSEGEILMKKISQKITVKIIDQIRDDRWISWLLDVI